MDLDFETKSLRALCESEREQKRQLGAANARKLRARLADLQAAKRVTELLAGRPHPLKGDRSGQFALCLDDGGCRLVFRPAEEPPPKRADGSISWEAVTAVTIVFIGDYHE